MGKRQPLRREVVLSPKSIQPVINGATAWVYYLRNIANAAERYPRMAGKAAEFRQKADDLMLSITVLTDALQLRIPGPDEPMTFGGTGG